MVGGWQGETAVVAQVLRHGPWRTSMGGREPPPTTHTQATNTDPRALRLLLPLCWARNQTEVLLLDVSSLVLCAGSLS